MEYVCLMHCELQYTVVYADALAAVRTLSEWWSKPQQRCFVAAPKLQESRGPLFLLPVLGISPAVFRDPCKYIHSSRAVLKMFTAEEESYLTIPDIEPVRTFLANALNLRLNGDKAQYELIVNQLRVRDDPDTLWKVLVALCSFTYQLTKQ